MTFVAWGAIHGVALVIERLLGLANLSKRSILTKIMWYLVVQSVIVITWVFFRSANLDQALQLIKNIASLRLSTNLDFPWLTSFVVMSPVLIMHARRLLEEQFPRFRVTLVENAIMAAVMAYFVTTFFGANNAFIYFQF